MRGLDGMIAGHVAHLLPDDEHGVNVTYQPPVLTRMFEQLIIRDWSRTFKGREGGGVTGWLAGWLAGTSAARS